MVVVQVRKEMVPCVDRGIVVVVVLERSGGLGSSIVAVFDAGWRVVES